MDIRVVESVATSGGMNDPSVRIDSSLENISLAWDETTSKLSIVDYNLDYSVLPFQIGSDMVKKVFLTYNGKNKTTGSMVETVLVQSSADADLNQIPGYRNSNEWAYTPSEFRYNPELRNLTNPLDYANMPFDYGQGFTVVRQFLTAQANVSPGTPAYTAFYRAPHFTSFLPANVESNRIYVDGWYTSYVIACKTWAVLDPALNGSTEGHILFYPNQNKFYKNITGAGGSLIQDPQNSLLLKPDTTNWSPDPNFEDWTDFMRLYVDSFLVDSPVYYAETQHLVTVELNRAILKELKQQCSCCHDPNFDTSKIIAYMKLMQKRLGAYVQFNAEIFHEASCILDSARSMCTLCLYNTDESCC